MRNIFKGFLLASDIDGTLIDKEFKIPQINKDFIGEFTKKGGFFTIATGRSVESARRFADELELKTPAIVLNGAALYDYKTNQFIYSNTLSHEAISLVRLVYDRFPKIGIEIHIGNRLHVIRESGEVLQHIQNESLPALFSSVDGLVDQKWHKLLFAAYPHELQDLELYVKNNPLKTAYSVKTSTTYFEVLNKDANKGRALKKIAEILHIDIDKTCAIGDYYNDIELINRAGISAYAENAPDDLKKTADYIAKHCEEGAVADFIQYLKSRILDTEKAFAGGKNG